MKRDKALHTVRLQPQLAHVPEYLLPAALRTESQDADAEVETPAVPKKRKQNGSFKSAKRHKYQVGIFLQPFLYRYIAFTYFLFPSIYIFYRI